MEITGKLKVSKATIHSATCVLERKVNDIITKFKMLVPHYSYKSKYLLNAEFIKIRPDICNCIRRDEDADGMTSCVIAKIFSIIYNYKVMVIGFDGREDYWLIQGGKYEERN
jgi:hypothetical protein